MKIYLVTGGSGFIGSNFIEGIKYNNNLIVNLDKKKPYKITNHLNLKNYIYIKGDINNKKLIIKILKKYNPDYIINFAANTHVDKSIYNPKLFFKNNVEGTLNLLQCCVEVKFKKTFLQISTDEVYGELSEKDKPFKEGSIISPNNAYSISKVAADQLVNYYSKTYNIKCMITRCSNNFGKWQNPEKLIPLTIMNCINKKKISVYGNGKNIRDWIDVRDHCQGIQKALKLGKKGETYLIGSNNEIQNIKIINMITKNFNKTSTAFNYNNLIKFVKDRLSHDKRYAINFSKAKSKLNFSPKFSFNRSLDDTIHHYIKNQKFYNNIISKSKWFKKHYG